MPTEEAFDNTAAVDDARHIRRPATDRTGVQTPGRVSTVTEVPDDLTHNPNASFAEMMEFRANFDPKNQPKAKPLEPATPIKISREQVIEICRAYKIPLLDDPENATGYSLHLGDKLKAAEDQRDALLTRAKAAEKALADIQAELDALKAAQKDGPNV